MHVGLTASPNRTLICGPHFCLYGLGYHRQIDAARNELQWLCPSRRRNMPERRTGTKAPNSRKDFIVSIEEIRESYSEYSGGVGLTYSQIMAHLVIRKKLAVLGLGCHDVKHETLGVSDLVEQ